MDETTELPEKVRVYKMKASSKDYNTEIRKFIFELYGEQYLDDEYYRADTYDFDLNLSPNCFYIGTNDPYLATERVWLEDGSEIKVPCLSSRKDGQISLNVKNIPLPSSFDVSDPSSYYDYFTTTAYYKAAINYLGITDPYVIGVSELGAYFSPYYIFENNGNMVQNAFESSFRQIRVIISHEESSEKIDVMLFIENKDVPEFTDEYPCKTYEEAYNEMIEKYSPRRFKDVNLDDIKATVTYQKYYTDGGEELIVPYYVFYVGNNRKGGFYSKFCEGNSSFSVCMAKGLPSEK